MKWGGFHNSHVGYVDHSSSTAAQAGADFDGVDVYTNAEIHFLPSITLDNGLTFGVDVQYEAKTNGGAIVDESFMFIKGDTLGKIELGNENSAGYKLSVAAPQVGGGIGINSPSISGFVPISTGAGGNLPWLFRDAGISSYTEVLANNDVPRISYYTPSFNGLTVGVSYAASSNTGGGSGVNAGNNFGVNRNVGTNDIFDIGVNYSQSFNGVDLALSARWGTASNDTGLAGTSDPEVWAIGGTIGVAGFTFGGSYAENDNGGLRAFDSEGWSLGATYDIAGPWAIGFDTYQGEYKGVGNGDKAEYEAYQLVASRTLGAGVRWGVYAAYIEGTVNANAGATFVDGLGNNNANTSTEGTVIGTSIGLSF
ncbi:porin [Roseovarius azorensis]|uniref:Porin n=2 Tax=Roseovarius azorensis TaxID=1287727 RepID=A0A1H7FWA2_9RHOB|nr:porin [Roseovarius azorensis]